MLNWPTVRTLVIRYTGIALALWGLPLGVAAAKIAVSRPPEDASSLGLLLMGLMPAAGMLLVGLLGLGLIAYSAGWLRLKR